MENTCINVTAPAGRGQERASLRVGLRGFARGSRSVEERFKLESIMSVLSWCQVDLYEKAWEKFAKGFPRQQRVTATGSSGIPYVNGYPNSCERWETCKYDSEVRAKAATPPPPPPPPPPSPLPPSPPTLPLLLYLYLLSSTLFLTLPFPTLFTVWQIRWSWKKQKASTD
ncbi:hypothetical protein HZH66_012077 [Vespula vulgaris]|uniref:Uncharacterized protein n=1 Tax=Vespula vulgaris TaxID=7454 RepID=A0A834JGC3_VESVU|nr:hypothetical protein HZH66_012077 [Vespula vulgaris]